jgi:hypothetical protein
MKIRPIFGVILIFASIHFPGCCKSNYEEVGDRGASVCQVIENKTIACLKEKYEKPEEIWNVFYDDEKNMFTSASERVCISRYGNIIHGTCESFFPMIREGQIYTDDDFGITRTIKYNIERMNIDIDFDQYRRKENRNLVVPRAISYAKLREPERHRMNRAASCLNSANISLQKTIKNKNP